jgi:hypothetical protein
VISVQPSEIPPDAVSAAIEAMTRAFIRNGADPDDARLAAGHYVREAIRLNKVPGFDTGTTAPPLA